MINEYVVLLNSPYPRCNLIAYNDAVRYALEMAKSTGQPFRIWVDKGAVGVCPMTDTGKGKTIRLASPEGILTCC